MTYVTVVSIFGSTHTINRKANMAITINAQGFVDQMVAKMQRTELDAAAELAVESQFSEIIEAAIERHGQAINHEMSKPPAERNQAVLSFHEKRIARYAR